MVTPAARREAVIWIRDRFGASWRRACGLTSCAVSVARHRSRRDGQKELRERLRELAGKKPRYGYRRLTWLLRREGEPVNPKRVYRLYQLEGLAVRKKKRTRLARAEPPRLQPVLAPNDRWSMDFMEDSAARGRRIRTLNVLDEYSRECLAIEVDTALSGERVCRVLGRLAAERGAPREISVDNGPEYTSVALGEWAANHGVELHFNRPGKPTDNPFIESFNGKFRDECLNENWFLGVDDARRIIEVWRKEYNEERPHMSLGMRPPAEFVALWSPPAPGAPQTPGTSTNPPGLS
jgi:putative transposase